MITPVLFTPVMPQDTIAVAPPVLQRPHYDYPQPSENTAKAVVRRTLQRRYTGGGYTVTRAQATVTHYEPPAPTPEPQQPSVTPQPGSYQACVLEHESGGNWHAVNPESGAGGGYQFLPSTWHYLGYPGLPQDASPELQTQAFDREYAANGTAPWITDGCK
jgi:hypothetical protein